MYKVLCHEDRHMALVGQTRGVEKLWSFLFDKNFPDIKAEKARILPSNSGSSLAIMGSLRYDSQAQV